MAMMEGLCPSTLFDSLLKNMLEALSILQAKANKYIAAKELIEAKQSKRGNKEDYKRKELDSRRTDYRGNLKARKLEIDARRRDHRRRPRIPPRRTKLMLPPLNSPIAQVLMKIKNDEFMK